MYLATTGAQLKGAIIILFIVVPIGPQARALCLPLPATERGLDPKGRSPLCQLHARIYGSPPSPRAPESLDPRSWGVRSASQWLAVSQNSYIASKSTPTFAAPPEPHFGDYPTFHAIPQLETGPCPGHLLAPPPPKPGGHCVLSSQPPEHLSNLLIRVRPSILSCPNCHPSLLPGLPASSPAPLEAQG